MHTRSGLVAWILAGALSAPAAAQWFDRTAPGVPRLPDGSPNLNAPAPKTADGRPDLSGIWNPEPGTIANIAKGQAEGFTPFQPWAEAIYKERLTGKFAHEESDANCLPQGVPKIGAAPAPWKIIQTPGEVIILYEAFSQFRQIFTDGRELPEVVSPTWLGYSVGRYEGDTLVVETTGFNGKTWLDQQGRPATDALKVTERFRRVDFGNMELTITIDDPKAYTKPWTVVQHPTLQVDGDLLEFVCLENEKSLDHLKAIAGE